MRPYLAGLAFACTLVCLVAGLLSIAANLWATLAWFVAAIICVAACKVAVGPEDVE